jgi:hypothetical protein
MRTASATEPKMNCTISEGDQSECKKDLQDVIAEEISRGRRHPKKTITLARRRMIGRMGEMLADPGCEKRTFLAVIREYGIEEGSSEFLQLCELWDARHR